jgi:outer membrane receptor protein involved in Fe transport
MKTLFTLLAVACSYLAVAQGNVKISGTVNDSTTNKGVEFATIALTETATGKVIDGAIADEKGNFTINKVGQGNYSVVISFIGFDTKTIKVVVDDKKDVDLGTITVSPTAKTLKEVTIEGQKALIEERVDRTIYNAENDATAKGGDATDVLKRVPMLSVDMDGNVSLRGNQNITVLINNKPSSIVASSVADALKQIPADQIKTVEVITSPSAKYDAEGSAGIINIVTKKNTLEGLTLNVDAGVGLRGSNLGLNGNYRKKKMGFSLGGWGRANYNIQGDFENEQIALDAETGEVLSINTQSASNRNRGMFGNYNLGWDYDINDKNMLAASVRFGLRNFDNFQDGLLNRQLAPDGTVLGSSLRDAITAMDANNVDVSLTYTHLYTKPQRELSFMALYGRNNNNSDFENFVLNETDFSTLSRIKNINDSYNQEMTFQADYQTPISTNQMFEIGGKNILRKVFSDFTYYTATGSDGEYVLSSSTNLSNNLNYDQNVTSGYMSYTYSTKSGYSLKAGSRYEYTTISAYTKTESDIKIDPYGVVVPSVNISKKLKGGNMIRASYNRRIQRPSIRFLNPNIQASNPLNITIGNPKLDPEFTNNYELSWSTFVKGTTINMSGFYRNTNDGIQSVRDIIGNDSSNPDTIRTQYQNIGYENAYGGSVFVNVMIGKLSLNGGGDVFYSVLDNNNPNPLYRASNEGWVANGRIFGSYNLDKGWGLQFFSFIRGRQVQLQGNQSGFYMYSLAIRKEFNEKRGSIGFGAENFLQPYIKMTNKLESPVLIQNSTNKMYNMSFRINFSYRIGKMSMDQQNRPRRRARGINNDDLKEGEGGMDGGNGGGGQPGGGGAAPTQGAPAGGGARPQMPTQQQSGPATPPPTIAKPAEGTIVEAAGTWTFTIDSPQGGGGTIVIKKENDVYSGTIKTDRMPQETAFTSVKVNGTEVIMNYTANFGGNSVPVEIKTNINATEMAGTMALGTFRTFNLTGKKAQ